MPHHVSTEARRKAGFFVSAAPFAPVAVPWRHPGAGRDPVARRIATGSRPAPGWRRRIAG